MAFSTSYRFDTVYDTYSYSRSSGDQRGGSVVALADRSLFFWYDPSSSSIAARIVYDGGSYAINTPAIASNVSSPLSGSGMPMPVSSARLANGNVVVTWVSATTGSDIYFTVLDRNLNTVVGPTLAETAPVAGARPDVAATSNGFVIAWEKVFSSSDRDIAYRRFDLNGQSSDTAIGNTVTGSTDLDRSASVAVQADDSIIIAWERVAGNASAIYQTIINADGSLRLAPTLVDNIPNSGDLSNIHRDVEVVTRSSGYALLYESSTPYGANDTDTIGKFFSSNGSLTRTSGVVTPVGNNADVAAATSALGLTLAVATTNTTQNGTDITASVVLANGSLALANVTIAGDAADDRVGGVAFIDDTKAWITWERAATSNSDAEIYAKEVRFARTVDGDSSNVTIVFNQDTIWTTVNAGDGNNIVATGGGNDQLVAGSGNDVLIGGAGNDTLTGGLGSNELYGGTGSDVYFVSTKNDTIVEYANEGVDSVATALTVYVLPNNVEGLYYTGGSVSFVGVGNAGDNTIRGGSGRDELYGYAGNDRLEDGGGVTEQEDTLFGGTGDDTYVISLKGASTKESAGEGNDTVLTTLGIYVLQANVENLTFTDNAAHDAGVGNELANVIRGGTGADAIYARDGDDTIYGGTGAANTLLGQGGNDTYYVQAVGDSVVEYANEGVDTVRSSIATFVLSANVENLAYVGSGTFTGIGNALSNQLNGGAGADTLSGLDGDDVLIGGSGADQLQGGNGQDAFAYVGGETGYDRITDFAAADDRILVSSAGFTRTTTLAFVSGAGATATSANSTFLYDTNTGIVSYDADGNGAGSAVQMAQLNLGLTLSIANFAFF